MALIHQQLKLAKEAIGVIPKAHENRGVGAGYNFRSVEDALNVTGPIFREHGILCVPRVVQHRTEAQEGSDKKTKCRATVLMEMDFIAEDDSKVTVSMGGEGVDFGGDKATSKAQSQAFKYCIFLGLQVPVQQGVLNDPDRPDRKKKGKKSSFDVAMSSIVNAVSLDVLERYERAAADRIADGQWTEQEVERIRFAIKQTKAELTK